MFARNSKFNRSARIILAVALVGLVAGVYYLFRPFPAGPSLEVAANVQEKSIARVPAAQKFDIGGGYMLETGSQGTRLVASSARLVAAPSSSVQKIDIGAGYFLENGPRGSRLIAPSVPRSVNSSVQRIDIGSGYMLELGPQATGKMIASSVPYAAKSPVQRIDIGGGYMLEFNAQGGKVIAPNTLVKGLP